MYVFFWPWDCCSLSPVVQVATIVVVEPQHSRAVEAVPLVACRGRRCHRAGSDPMFSIHNSFSVVSDLFLLHRRSKPKLWVLSAISWPKCSMHALALVCSFAAAARTTFAGGRVGE